MNFGIYPGTILMQIIRYRATATSQVRLTVLSLVFVRKFGVIIKSKKQNNNECYNKSNPYHLDPCSFVHSVKHWSPCLFAGTILWICVMGSYYLFGRRAVNSNPHYFFLEQNCEAVASVFRMLDKKGYSHHSS